MKTYRIAVLPGDGIGPEVIAQALRVLEAVGERFSLRFALETLPIGAAAVAVANNPLPPETRAAVVKSDAVLLGAVGDPSLDTAPRELRPETGLLALRKLLNVYANLRPVAVHPALAACSPLKPERLRGVDILVVRELTGGLYYGEPRGRNGTSAVNTLVYSAAEIDRVTQVAFEAARGRRRLVTSVDKANVLEVSQLWREIVTRVARDYPEVRLEHCYVDTAAMRLVSDPATFDVVLTENMFGDMKPRSSRARSACCRRRRSVRARGCSSRCTDRPRRSPAVTSPIRSVLSRPWPCCCATGSTNRKPPPR